MNTWPTIALSLLALYLRPCAANQCGISPSITKIVGGNDVPNVKFPWYVALVVPSSSSSVLSVSCGGSLITSRHVLSAAHCFPRDSTTRPENMYRAVFGLTNRCEQRNAESSRISRVRLYPSFNAQTLEGDIAVLTLAQPVSHTPICLPPKGSVVTGEASITGFGSTLVKTTSQYPCVLQEAFIDILSRRRCQRSGLEAKFSNLPGIYCAGELRGGVDSCDGDSGGPLQTKSSGGVYTLQGVVSFGVGCGRRDLPGVYTQVSYYRDFIDRAISDTDSDDLGTAVDSGESSVLDTPSNPSHSSSSSSLFDFPYILSIPSIFDSSSFSSPFSSFLDDWNPWGSRGLPDSSWNVNSLNSSGHHVPVISQRPPAPLHSLDPTSSSPFSSFLNNWNPWGSPSSPNISQNVYNYSSAPVIIQRPSSPFYKPSSLSSSSPLSSFLYNMNPWSSRPSPNTSLNVNSSSSSSSGHRAPVSSHRPPSSLHSILQNIFNKDRRRDWNFTMPWSSRVGRSMATTNNNCTTS